MLQDPKDVLIVIADGEHARFVRPAHDYALKTERSLDSAAAHHRSADLASDRPGASFHSDSTAHHAVTPRNDPHELAKESFAHYVADQIKDATGRNEFGRLIIVAPSRVLSVITGALDSAVRPKLLGTLDRDLVKVPDHELQPHLREWIRPVHRAT